MNKKKCSKKNIKRKGKFFLNQIVDYFNFLLILALGPLLSFIIIKLINSGRIDQSKLDYVYMIPIGQIIVVGLLLIVSFVNSHRVRHLVEAINRVGEGDFSEAVEIKASGYSVYNSIYKNFNSMVKELRSNKLLKEDFINNFSHEFKTPIASINGFASLMLENELSEEEKKQYLQIIADESKRLASLSHNTLLISRLGSAAITTENQNIRIDEQIKQCAILLMKNWEAKKINMDFENIQSVTYFCNDELFKEIWINLLNNAIKFTPENGNIKISLTKKSDGKGFCAIVQDSGIGMTEEVCTHIFEQYYQGDKSHSVEGNGLGLSIVQKIVALYKGKIEVQSQIGKGSSFIVTFF